MTDLLTRDPNDTGDIPAPAEVAKRTDVGVRTQNLTPYVHGLAPALRRPTAGLPTVAAGEAELTPPGQPKPPRPLPAPPKPKADVEVVWGHAEPSENYLGRHRRPSRWDWLTVPLAMAWQRIGRSL